MAPKRPIVPPSPTASSLLHHSRRPGPHGRRRILNQLREAARETLIAKQRQSLATKREVVTGAASGSEGNQ